MATSYLFEGQSRGTVRSMSPDTSFTREKSFIDEVVKNESRRFPLINRFSSEKRKSTANGAVKRRNNAALGLRENRRTRVGHDA